MPCARMHCAYASAIWYGDDVEPPLEVVLEVLGPLHAASRAMPSMASSAPVHSGHAGRGQRLPNLSFIGVSSGFGPGRPLAAWRRDLYRMRPRCQAGPVRVVTQVRQISAHRAGVAGRGRHVVYPMAVTPLWVTTPVPPAA